MGQVALTQCTIHINILITIINLKLSDHRRIAQRTVRTHNFTLRLNLEEVIPSPLLTIVVCQLYKLLNKGGP